MDGLHSCRLLCRHAEGHKNTLLFNLAFTLTDSLHDKTSDFITNSDDVVTYDCGGRNANHCALKCQRLGPQVDRLLSGRALNSLHFSQVNRRFGRLRVHCHYGGIALCRSGQGISLCPHGKYVARYGSVNVAEVLLTPAVCLGSSARDAGG